MASTFEVGDDVAFGYADVGKEVRGVVSRVDDRGLVTVGCEDGEIREFTRRVSSEPGSADEYHLRGSAPMQDATRLRKVVPFRATTRTMLVGVDPGGESYTVKTTIKKGGAR